MVLVPSATAGGVPLVLARLVEGLSTHQCAGGPWRLEDRRNCSQVSPCAGRLPSGRGPNADRPSMSWATSTARRIAAATWIMSSTTVASRAYAVVPAKRSRWSRGGAYRPRSAPAAGSARHRADAGRRDRAARSPDPQPASCRRSFRRGYPARAAPSTGHHWRPRPDRQPVPGCVGRDVLAGACVPTSGPAGAVPVRVRSRSSAGLRWRRGRLWHPRRQHRPLRTGPGSGDRCEGRRFAPLARRIYVPGILSSQPSQVCPPAHGTVPERRANVQKGARPRGTDRRYSVPFRGSAGRRKDAGTCWLGCCPPEMSTGETHPRAKRPMNRAKTPLRRRAAPFAVVEGYRSTPPDRALMRELLDCALGSVKRFEVGGRQVAASVVHHVGLALYVRADAAGIVEGFSVDRIAADVRLDKGTTKRGIAVLRRLRAFRSTRASRRRPACHRINVGGLDWPGVRERAKREPSGCAAQPLSGCAAQPLKGYTEGHVRTAAVREESTDGSTTFGSSPTVAYSPTREAGPALPPADEFDALPGRHGLGR